jgi:tetratricopeptide (TPR) repeat protein
MTILKPRISGIIFFIFISSIFVHAQNPEADSLKALLLNTPADTMKVYLMYKISDAYSLTQLPEAKKYADSALELAQKINYIKGVARSHTRLGNIFNKTGQFDTSLAEQLTALLLCEKMKDETGIAASYNNIALMYTTRSLSEDYKNAIRNFIKAKESYEKLKDSSKLTTVLLNIGDGYEKMDMLDSAFIFSGKAKEIALRRNDYESLGAIFINLGYISYKRNNIDAALKDLRSGIYYMKKIEDNYSLATAWFRLALCFNKLNKTDSFQVYAKKAIELGDSTSNYSTVLDAANQLSKHYAATGNFASYFIYKELAAKKDSIINNNKQTVRIEQLKLQEQMRQEGITATRLQAAELRSQNIQKGIIIGLIITLFIALLIFSQKNVHPRAVEALSVIVLLLAFEFITLIIHPYVEKLTHHNPIYMLMILAGVAGLLGPLHHRLTHLLKHKLVRKHHHHGSQRKTPEKIKVADLQKHEVKAVIKIEANHKPVVVAKGTHAEKLEHKNEEEHEEQPKSPVQK